MPRAAAGGLDGDGFGPAVLWDPVRYRVSFDLLPAGHGAELQMWFQQPRPDDLRQGRRLPAQQLRTSVPRGLLRVGVARELRLHGRIQLGTGGLPAGERQFPFHVRPHLPDRLLRGCLERGFLQLPERVQEQPRGLPAGERQLAVHMRHLLPGRLLRGFLASGFLQLPERVPEQPGELPAGERRGQQAHPGVSVSFPGQRGRAADGCPQQH